MIKEHFDKFWRSFSRPHVYLFILMGTAIIFLTFLTNDNAMEIAISGFASVFIGIGVNNFSSYETHHKDDLVIRRKIKHALSVLNMAEDKIIHIRQTSLQENTKETEQKFRELTEYIRLLKQLLTDEETPDNK
ncbi:MAG: hypothetical protein DI535_09260 [Citrobacter freundii]|nr:MAG: hypothetical protein DI535_09260 [Citrobacter freundii]